MMPETDNAIYGQTCSAWNPLRTAGGSSGGEALLLSSAASILGVGTDIGGSVRIPAHFSGICGFKPSPKRNSLVGLNLPRHYSDSSSNRVQPSTALDALTIDGMHAIANAAGPMARYVDDLTLILKAWYVHDKGYLLPL
jgi:Asp-tRNA(Asn)/Glu-tRNA(Gln) amidotransferase A subunit family amidase